MDGFGELTSSAYLLDIAIMIPANPRFWLSCTMRSATHAIRCAPCTPQIRRITISSSHVIPRRANVTVVSPRAQGRKETADGAIHGPARIAHHASVGVFVFDQSPRHQVENSGVGAGAADHVRVSRFLLDIWTAAFFSRGQRRQSPPGLCVRGIGICVWRAWQTAFLDRLYFCVSGSSVGSFHRFTLCAVVLPRR